MTNNKIVQNLISLGVDTELLKIAHYNSDIFLDAVDELFHSRLNKLNESKSRKNSLKKVFETSNGKLYKGDCLKMLQTKIQDNSVDCVFADPPFNLSKNYGNNINDKRSEEDYLEWTYLWLDLCFDKLKEGGSLFVFNIPKWSVHISKYLSQKMTFRNWIAVDMTFSMPIPNKLYPSHYSLLYFTKGSKPNVFTPPRIPMLTCKKCGHEQKDYGGYKKKINAKGFNLRDVWTDIPPVRHSKYKNREANELSVKLVSRVLDLSTKEGDLVLDPFGGSGTTFAVSEIMNRKWIGAELGDCEPIISRLKNLNDDKNKLFEYNKVKDILFTDEDLFNRYRYDLPLDSYNVSEQINRVLERFVFK